MTEAQPSRFYLHEGYFSNILELERDELDCFIDRMEKGGTGAKSKGTWVPNPSPYNREYELRDTSVVNSVGFYYAFSGAKRKGHLFPIRLLTSLMRRAGGFASVNPTAPLESLQFPANSSYSAG